MGNANTTQETHAERDNIFKTNALILDFWYLQGLWIIKAFPDLLVFVLYWREDVLEVVMFQCLCPKYVSQTHLKQVCNLFQNFFPWMNKSMIYFGSEMGLIVVTKADWLQGSCRWGHLPWFGFHFERQVSMGDLWSQYYSLFNVFYQEKQL